MKRIFRLLLVLLLVSSLAGITASCSIFSNSHVQKHEPFKHKQPLPKKYIINNDSKAIVK